MNKILRYASFTVVFAGSVVLSGICADEKPAAVQPATVSIDVLKPVIAFVQGQESKIKDLTGKVETTTSQLTEEQKRAAELARALDGKTSALTDEQKRAAQLAGELDGTRQTVASKDEALTGSAQANVSMSQALEQCKRDYSDATVWAKRQLEEKCPAPVKASFWRALLTATQENKAQAAVLGGAVVGTFALALVAANSVTASK